MSSTPFLTVRQQILTAALDLFAERGPDAVSLRQLAGRVGLHNSTLFHYFPDKASLTSSVLDAVAQRQLEWLERLADDDPPRLETLGTVLEAWDGHLQAAPAEARLLLAAFAGPGSAPATSAPLERMVGLLQRWLERADVAGVVHCPRPAVEATRLLALALFRPDFSLAASRAAGELSAVVAAVLTRPQVDRAETT